jgi:hypothetical protein
LGNPDFQESGFTNPGLRNPVSDNLGSRIMMNRDLERLQQELAAVMNGLSGEQWTWHPPGKWCAAEILEHLYLTYTGTIKGFEKMLQAGEPRTTSTSWKQRRQKTAVLTFGYFPSGREAPSRSQPRGLPAEQVRSEIVQKIREMHALIASGAQKFGERKELLDHPILGPLTAAQWMRFHRVHGLHHLKQIQRLQKDMQNQ